LLRQHAQALENGLATTLYSVTVSLFLLKLEKYPKIAAYAVYRRLAPSAYRDIRIERLAYSFSRCTHSRLAPLRGAHDRRH
jgi:hypothetical protein